MALIEAVKERNVEKVLEILSDSSYNVNEEEKSTGLTALMIASSNAENTKDPSLTIIAQLLQHPKINVNFSIRENNSLPPELIANEEIFLSIFLLCTDEIQDHIYVKGQTALHKAAGNECSIPAVLLLSDPRSCVNQADAKGLTPLHVASKSGHGEVVTLILSKDDCDPNIQDEEGQTALHFGSEKGHIACVELLTLDERVDVNLRDEKLNTALNKAVFKRQTDAVKLLLGNKKCDLNLPDKDDNTPLIWAAQLRDIPTATLLIRDARCDVNAQDSLGQTALYLFTTEHRHETNENTGCGILEELINHPNISPSFKMLTGKGESVIVGFLESLGDISKFKTSPYIAKCLAILLSKSHEMTTLPSTLALATYRASYDICEQILEKIPDANSSYSGNETALYCAVKTESRKKCELLVRHNADLDVTWKGLTPLQFGIAHSCRPDILEILSKDISYQLIAKELERLSVVGETPLTCSLRLGVLSWVKHFATEEAVFERDGTGANAAELSCKDQKLLEIIQSLNDRPILDENAEHAQWYKSTKGFSCKIRANPSDRKFQSYPEYKEMLRNLAKCLNQNYSEKKVIIEAVFSLVKILAATLREDKTTSHFSFKPKLAGSMAEGTKTFVPNEVDVICQFTELDGVYVSEDHSEVRIDASVKSPWFDLCLVDPKTGEYEEVSESDAESESDLENDSDVSSHHSSLNGKSIDDKEDGKRRLLRICPVKLSVSVYDAIDKALTKIIQRGIKFGNLHLFHRSLELRDRISCLHLLWRGTHCKDMIIHVDLVPSFTIVHENEPGVSFPLEPRDDYCELVAKERRHGFETAQTMFTDSHSGKERTIIKALPPNVRSGLITAKAIRLAAICTPKEILSLFLQEDISSEDFITSYTLKTCLFHVLSEPIDFNGDQFEWADRIYEKLEEFLEDGTVRQFHGRDVVFYCHHKEVNYGCCFKKNVMLHLCKQIRKWTAAKHLVYRRDEHSTNPAEYVQYNADKKESKQEAELSWDTTLKMVAKLKTKYDSMGFK